MLRDEDKASFEMLKLAANHGDLALVETTTQEGEYVALACIAVVDPNTDEWMLTPIAEMVNGDPMGKYVDPIQALEEAR